MGWSGWLLMSLLIIVCLVVVGGLAYLLARGARTHDHSGYKSDPPVQRRPAAEETLDDRLARGEIDVSEYQQRKAALRGS